MKAFCDTNVLLDVLTPAEFLATHFADQAGTAEEQGT